MCIRDSCSTEGTAAFQTDLPFGKYYVKEVATDQHYLLSEETYPVDFTYQGQDTAVVHISANEENAIENELIRGKISGKMCIRDSKLYLPTEEELRAEIETQKMMFYLQENNKK